MMNRWILAMAITALAASAVQAQVVSQYGGSGVYVPGSTYAPVAPSPAVSSAYYSEPAYAPAPAYSYPAPVYAPPVYAAPVYARPVYVAPSPIVPMAYSVPVYSAPVMVPAPVVVARPVYAAPVPLYGPNYVRQTTRALPNNYTQVTRVYGPTPGPHYSRVHVHNGPLGTTVRERIR